MLVDDAPGSVQESESTAQQQQPLSAPHQHPSSFSVRFMLSPPVASVFTSALSAHFLGLSPSSLFVHVHSITRLSDRPSPAPSPPPPPSTALYRWTRTPSSQQAIATAVDYVAAYRSDECVELELLTWLMAQLALSSMLLALVDPALSLTILRVQPSITQHQQQQQRKRRHEAHDAQQTMAPSNHT